MFMCIFYLLLSLAPLILANGALADIVLDQQCWHEYPLSVANLYSLPDRVREYATLIQTYTVDEQPNVVAKEEDYAPWSYPPVCTDVLQSINDKLCVYTDSSFGNGRGISIFTTPKLARQVTSLPAFQDPSALDAQNINTFTGTWKATPIAGKGIGMLASKPLQFKDRITAYTPAFIAYLETELSTSDREAWWRVGIEQLPAKIKENFLSLTYVFGDERVRVQDIVKANTFQLNIEGVNHLVVFPETSRLNHACNPNAQYVIDSELLTHTVHATRPIAEGEEITISYTSPLEPTSVRQENLQHGFHFTCTCPRCADGWYSDQILEAIDNLQNQLNDWSSNPSDSTELAEQILQMHRDEGLEGFMDIAYGFAALAYNAAGKSKKAVHFAKKAEEALLMKDGKWAPNLQLWNDLRADPKKHWSYRRRL